MCKTTVYQCVYKILKVINTAWLSHVAGLMLVDVPAKKVQTLQPVRSQQEYLTNVTRIIVLTL